MTQPFKESRLFQDLRQPYIMDNVYYPLGTFINDDVDELNSNGFIQLYPTVNSVTMFNQIYNESKEQYYKRFKQNSSLYNVNVQLLREYIGDNKILNIGAEFVENVGYTDSASRIIFVEFETTDHDLGLFYLGGLGPTEAKNDETRNDHSFSYDKPIFYVDGNVKLNAYHFADFICALDKEYFGHDIDYPSQFKDFENWHYVAGSIMDRNIREAKTPEETEIQARVETKIPVTKEYEHHISQHPIDFCDGSNLGPLDNNN